MCFGIPQSEGIGSMAGLPCCGHTRLGDFLRFARAVKHAAQSDARLPESSTADVVSGNNVIVIQIALLKQQLGTVGHVVLRSIVSDGQELS